LKGIEATKTILDVSAQERAAYWDDIRLERATEIYDRAPKRGKNDSILASAAALGKTGGRAIAEAFDMGVNAAGLLFSLMVPPKTPGQLRREAIKAEAERELQAEQHIDFSKYTADRAQERRNDQEQQAARDRQREVERADDRRGRSEPPAGTTQQNRKRPWRRQSAGQRQAPHSVRRNQAAIPGSEEGDNRRGPCPAAKAETPP
jgi:hypothetical protein